jgi:hypothetical protein
MVVVVVVVVVVNKKRARKGAKAQKANPNSDEGTRSYCDGGKMPVT